MALPLIPLQIVLAGHPAESARQLGAQRRIAQARAWRIRARPAEKTGVFELLHIGEIAQRLEAEMRQERRRRDIGVGRAGLRGARPGADEPRPAQRGDRVGPAAG